MSRHEEPAIPNELLDRLLAGGDAGTALAQGGLLDALKKALTERKRGVRAADYAACAVG